MTAGLLTEEEAIAYLGLDRQGLKRPDEALRWLRRMGRVKFARLGRYIRYRQQWLDEAIEESAIRCSPPVRGPQPLQRSDARGPVEVQLQTDRGAVRNEDQ